MDVILIPGFRLDASSWNEVTRLPVVGDERRRDVPTTVVTCEYPAAQLAERVAGGAPFARPQSWSPLTLNVSQTPTPCS